MYLQIKMMNEVRQKEMLQAAENERLARQHKDNHGNRLQATRQMLGRSLVTMGQKLLNGKQEAEYQHQSPMAKNA